MTKNRCKICELLGESQIPNHGLSHPCHLTNLHQLNHHLTPGLNYNPSPSMNYLNHGLLNGLYLPQLKDMMLAAYLLRADPNVTVADVLTYTRCVQIDGSSLGNTDTRSDIVDGFRRWICFGKFSRNLKNLARKRRSKGYAEDRRSKYALKVSKQTGLRKWPFKRSLQTSTGSERDMEKERDIFSLNFLDYPFASFPSFATMGNVFPSDLAFSLNFVNNPIEGWLDDTEAHISSSVTGCF
uniref:Uncharacterized protein n=1 Tax=Vespula pensylvanica TaxID=30213 RepID=A0A834UDR7_VESPE|nr:hypothetical protein H0235_005332 [Vespula pensylvanica]